MRDLFFFRHYITELQNPNIAALFKRYGAKGYGLFWHLMERLYADDTHTLYYDKALIKNLSDATKIRKIQVKMILADMEALRLISFRGDYICSDRVDNEIREVIKSRKRRKDDVS